MKYPFYIHSGKSLVYYCTENIIQPPLYTGDMLHDSLGCRYLWFRGGMYDPKNDNSRRLSEAELQKVIEQLTQGKLWAVGRESTKKRNTDNN